MVGNFGRLHRSISRRSYRMAVGTGRLFEPLEPRTLLTADFTVVSLGDTQYLTENDPQHELAAMTQWVANNAVQNNIAFLSQQGDFLRRGYSNVQAANGAAALAVLNGKVPYSVDIGNHDFDNQFDDLDHHISSANFTSWFGDSFYQSQNTPGAVYGGSSLDQRNHYQIVTPAGGGPQFMVLSLEWEAEDSAIAWAQGVINAHRDLPVILTTHEYLNGSGRTTSPLDPAGNAGQAIFTKLVSPNPQIFLVLSGHSGTVYHQTSTDASGLSVFETTADFAGDANGADSYLQLFDFSPNNNAINVTTYSPVLGSLTGANYSFSLPINFANRFAFANGAIANDGTFDALPGNAINGAVSDFDSTGASLTATLVTGPAHDTSFTLNSDGTFAYVPAQGFHGNDTFTYTVSDGTSTSKVATVTLRMNTAPVAANDTAATTLEGKAVIVNVSPYESDADGDVVTPILTTLPTHGAVFANADGTFTYTPDPKYTGSDSFTYMASDGKAASSPATVTVTITAAAPGTIAYDYPIAEKTTSGTKTGSYANVGATDGNLETITEITHSGSTVLNQQWTFNVTGGGSEVTFCINGWHPTGTDEYHLQYSTNGSSWSDLTQIVPASSENVTRYRSDAGEPYQMWLLPAATKGTLYIRATNAMSNSVPGALAVDEMFVRTTGIVPAVVPNAPSGLAATHDSKSRQATLTWTDNSNNETGFRVWYSTDGITWKTYASLAANTTRFTTPQLTAKHTYFFKVTAFNLVGDSVFSNMITLST